MNNENKTEMEKVIALGSRKFCKNVKNNGEFVQSFLQYIVKHKLDLETDKLKFL